MWRRKYKGEYANMANLQYEVYHFPAGEAGSTNITSAVELMDDDGINTAAGVYTLTVGNKNGIYKDELKYGDKIKINFGNDESGTSTVIFGKIEEEEYDYSTGRITKTIKGYGPSRELQNFLVNQIVQSGASYTVNGATYGYDEINSRNVVKLIMAEHVNAPGDINIDYTEFVDSSSGCKPWANTVGSDFFKAWVNTEPSKCINEIRTDAYTGNGDYSFYIDENNKLHFQPKGTSNASITLTEGSNILAYSMKRSIKPEFTCISLFCGKDENGLGIYAAGYNSAGISQYGYKWGYANYGWLWENVSGNNAGDTLANIKSITKTEGRALATSLAESQGLPKWKGKFTLRGTTEFTLGSAQYVNVVLPSVSERFNPGSLVLTDVKHNFNNRGWTTTIECDESSGEIFG